MSVFKRFSSKKKATDWHVRITSLTEDILLVEDWQLNPDYPWALLQSETDISMREMKFTNQENRNTYLVDLINAHTNKQAAIAACGKLISSSYLRNTVAALPKLHPPHSVCLFDYLLCLIAANRTNKEAVLDSDVTWAFALLPFSDSSILITNGQVAGQRLKILAVMSRKMETSELVPWVTVRDAIKTAVQDFSTHVRSLLCEAKWFDAYKAIQWLRDLETVTGMTEDEKKTLLNLLDAFGAQRKDWQSWQPSESRLKLWDSLSIQEQKKWYIFGILEGPDLTGNCKNTLREGLLERGYEVSESDKTIQNLRLSGVTSMEDFGVSIRLKSAENASEVMNSHANMFEAFCQSNSELKALFEDLFASKIIDVRALEIFEDVLNLGESALSSAVANLIKLKTSFGREEFYDMIRVLSQLSYDHETRLWEHLESRILVGIVLCFTSIKTDLSTKLLSESDWMDFDLSLQTLKITIDKSTWVQPRFYALCPAFRPFAERWPSHERIQTLFNIIRGSSSAERHCINVVTLIKSYCHKYLLLGNYLDPVIVFLAETLVSLWEQLVDDKSRLREIALEVVDKLCTVAQGDDRTNTKDPHWKCLEYLPKLSFKLTHELAHFFSEDVEKMVFASSALADMMIYGPESEILVHFQPLLSARIDTYGRRLSEVALQCLKAENWWQWVHHVAIICDFQKFDDTNHSQIPNDYPHPLSSDLLAWKSTLQKYMPIICTLESALGQKASIQCVMRSYREVDSKNVLQMLELISDYNQYSEECATLMLCMMGQLEADGNNAKLVLRALSAVTKASESGIACCKSLCQDHSPALKQVMLSSWLQPASNMTPNDCNAFKALGVMFGLRTDSTSLSAIELKAGADHLDQRVAELIQQAKVLSKLRLELKLCGGRTAGELLKQIGMEDSVIAEEVLASLPQTLLSLVEMVGDEELELHFPLTEFKGLRRTAMDLGEVKTLFVRLKLQPSGLPSAFCMHLNHRGGEKTKRAGIGSATEHNDVTSHRYQKFDYGHTSLLQAPDRPFCGNESSRTLYQVTRALFRWMRGNGKSVEEVYGFISRALQKNADYCMVCGATTQKDILKRATTCSPGCSRMFRQSSLDVRLVDLRIQPEVADLLLTAVHAAAASGKSVLLPECPVAPAANVIQILYRLPALSTLVKDGELSPEAIKVLFTLNSTEKLFLWCLSHYRGFLVAAPGNLRIPSMPGTLQFILASATPTIERRFASRLGGKTPKILFHGTTMDRLFAILSQGLIVCSGTQLQAHGASQGRGIYLSDEPRTPMGYATPFNPTPGTGWRHSSFRNFRVMLGCEYAGDFNSPAGVWVVPSPDLIVIRFVFLIPAGMIAPVARHIVPAMESICSSLRKGTA